MTPEDRSKISSFIGEIDGLRSREPNAKRFKDWKENVEKKLEEACGKGSEEAARFRRVGFFSFERPGKAPDAPLNEAERKAYLAGLDEARRILSRCM